MGGLQPGRRRLRHQKRLHHGCRATGADQHLEHIVQRRGVGATRLDHRLDQPVILAERVRGHADLVALHPVDVALQRVDLAVVGQHAEGLGQAPFREGVGGITLVEDGDRAGEPRIPQVGIEVVDMLRQEHALVDQGPGGEGADIEGGHARGGHLLLDPLADQEQGALELGAVRVVGDQGGGGGQHDLLDLGTGGVGLLPDHGGVHRHLAPAIDVESRAQHLALDDGAAGLLRAQVGAGQEDLADRDGTGLHPVADPADLVGEEVLRHVEQDARPVAGLAVGVHGAPVPDGLQGADGQLHHFPAGLAVHGADKADAAIVPLAGRVIGAGLGQQTAVGEIAVDGV